MAQKSPSPRSVGPPRRGGRHGLAVSSSRCLSSHVKKSHPLAPRRTGPAAGKAGTDARTRELPLHFIITLMATQHGVDPNLVFHSTSHSPRAHTQRYNPLVCTSLRHSHVSQRLPCPGTRPPPSNNATGFIHYAFLVHINAESTYP